MLDCGIFFTISNIFLLLATLYENKCDFKDLDQQDRFIIIAFYFFIQCPESVGYDKNDKLSSYTGGTVLSAVNIFLDFDFEGQHSIVYSHVNLKR